MDLKTIQKCTGQMSLGVLIILGFFAALWYILAHEIPTANHDLVVFLLGVLAGFGGSVVSYYYGSSIKPPETQQPGVTVSPVVQVTTDPPAEAKPNAS